MPGGGGGVLRVEGQHFVEAHQRRGGVAGLQQALAFGQGLLEAPRPGRLLALTLLFGAQAGRALGHGLLQLGIVELAGQRAGLGQRGQGRVEPPLVGRVVGLAQQALGLLAHLARQALALAVLGLGAPLRQVGVQGALADRARDLLALEEALGGLEVALAQVAQAHLVVGQVVDELEAVGLLLERRLRLQEHRRLERLEGLVEASRGHVPVARLEVVVVPVLDAPGAPGRQQGQGQQQRDGQARGAAGAAHAATAVRPGGA